MDSVSNNEYAATSQAALSGANFITGRDLMNHIANLTNQERRKSVVQNRSPNDTASSPTSYLHQTSNPGGGSNAANSEEVRACAEIYSAILNSQQHVGDEQHLPPAASFGSPTRHLSEPATAAVRHSPVGSFYFFNLHPKELTIRQWFFVSPWLISCASPCTGVHTFAHNHTYKRSQWFPLF